MNSGVGAGGDRQQRQKPGAAPEAPGQGADIAGFGPGQVMVGSPAQRS